MKEQEFLDTVENSLDCIIKLFNANHYNRISKSPEDVEKYIRAIFSRSIELAITYGKVEAARIIQSQILDLKPEDFEDVTDTKTSENIQ